MFLLRADADLQAHIFSMHPKLRQLSGIDDPKKMYSVCYDYVKEFRTLHEKESLRLLQQIEQLWRPTERKYLQTLSEHFETAYPPRHTVMRAYVSIVPMYPRWLDTWSFNVSYIRPERVKEIACHEIQHFLYFKKWMEVFPKTKRAELDNPHLPWRLSELIAPVIMNEHPYCKTLINRKQTTYKHFQQIRIRGRQPTTHLKNMYRRHLRSGAPFKEFLKEIWQFAQDNTQALMNA
jgi:hypothetical protein